MNEVDPFDFKNSLLSAIKRIGLENELRNDVFHWTRERDFFEHVACWVDKEPMDYLRKAQVLIQLNNHEIWIRGSECTHEYWTLVLLENLDRP